MCTLQICQSAQVRLFSSLVAVNFTSNKSCNLFSNSCMFKTETKMLDAQVDGHA